jgi:hypothetical protein
MSLLPTLLLLLVLSLAGAVLAMRAAAARRLAALEARVIAPEPRPAAPLPEPLRALAQLTAESLPEGAVALRLRQSGRIRLGPDRPWLRFTAVQTVSLTKPAFCWTARLRLAPGLAARVVDAYEGGEGLLDARLFGLAPVARASGPGMAVAEAQRYLAELAWAPGALALNGHLAFRSADGRLPVEVMAGDRPARVALEVAEDGRITGMRAAARLREGDTGAVLTPWAGRFTEWDTALGPPLPRRGEVWWELPSGPHVYFRGRIDGLEALDARGRVIEP